MVRSVVVAWVGWWLVVNQDTTLFSPPFRNHSSRHFTAHKLKHNIAKNANIEVQ
jgi:hypothetical protein